MKNPHFGPWATDDEPYAASIPPNQLTYDTYAFDTVDAPSDAFTALFQLHPDIRNRILQPFPKIQQALARHLMQNGALTTFARSHHLTIYQAQRLYQDTGQSLLSTLLSGSDFSAPSDS